MLQVQKNSYFMQCYHFSGASSLGVRGLTITNSDRRVLPNITHQFHTAHVALPHLLLLLLLRTKAYGLQVEYESQYGTRVAWRQYRTRGHRGRLQRHDANFATKHTSGLPDFDHGSEAIRGRAGRMRCVGGDRVRGIRRGKRSWVYKGG